MDGDPAVEPALDTFSLILPLPYRIAVIVVLGTILNQVLAQRFSLIVQQASGLGVSIYIICLS